MGHVRSLRRPTALRSPRRSLVLSLVATASILALGVPQAGAEPTAPPTSQPTAPPAPTPISEADRARVAELRDDAEEQFERLAEATTVYEEAKQELDEATKQARAMRTAADEAAAEWKRMRADLEFYIGAVFRSPIPDDVLILTVQATGSQDALRAATDLDHMSDRQSDVVDRTEELRDAARELSREADELAERAKEKAAELEKVREELVARSEEVTSRLTAEVNRIGGSGGSRASVAQVWSCDGRTLTQVGSWPNGLIPDAALCDLPQEGHQLRGDAAKAFGSLNTAFKGRFGRDMCLISSYRDLATQHRLYATRPAFAAVPGHSNHGWGMAVDLCESESQFNTTEYNWLKANSARWGWVHPAWAEPDGSLPESWHWEYALG